MTHVPHPEAGHEWQAQERAFQDERREAAGSPDPLVAQYRHVVHALRQPSPGPSPDFAAGVARIAAAPPPRRTHALEQGLVQGLFVLLALSAAVATARYGSQWVQGLSPLWPGSPASPVSLALWNWGGALAACIATSWLLGRWRTR